MNGGSEIHKIWIKKDLENIFEYRKKVIEKLLTLEKSNIVSMDEYKGATA